MSTPADPSTIAMSPAAVSAGRDVTIPGTLITGSISGDLHIHQAPHTENVLPAQDNAPPSPERPPRTEEFIGREAELECYGEMLRATRFVILTGMAGVGKTALVAELVRRYTTPEKVFWHTFGPDEDIQVIIEQLAVFLYHNRQPGLWLKLQGPAGRLPLTPQTLFNYVFDEIGGHGYVLCFDALDRLNKASLPLLRQLVERLRGLVMAQQLAVIVTAQLTPAFLLQIEPGVLRGLNRDDATHLLTANGIRLPAEVFESLYRRTEGNAQLLLFAGIVLRNARGREAQIVGQLGEAPNIIYNYLLAAVNEHLTEDERWVMKVVAVLMGQPCAEDAVEAILDVAETRLILRELLERHLITASETDGVWQYSQQPIVQSFYYGLIRQDQRKRLHASAAAFYRERGADALRAAIHYERVEEYAQAALLATQDTWAAIRHGQGAVLQALLNRLGRQRLSPILTARISLALGHLRQYAGEIQDATKCYKSAFDLAEREPRTPETRVLTARICRSMGDLVQFENYRAAQEWLERGIVALENYDSGEEAALRVVLAGVLLAQGDLDSARTEAERGLTLLPEAPGSERIDAWITLSTIHGQQGDMATAKMYSEHALVASEEVHDQFGALKALNNLGLIGSFAGDWAEAVTTWERGLAIARDISQERRQAELSNNLGMLYLKKRAETIALQHLRESLRLAQKHALSEYELSTQLNLAQLYLQQGDQTNARAAHAEAARLTDALQARFLLAEVQRVAAQIALADGDLAAAQDSVNQSVAAARELQMTTEEGATLRVQGQILAAAGKAAAAREAFDHSLLMIGAGDPYETAQTHAEFSAFWIAEGDTERGQSHRTAAQAIFAGLGVAEMMSGTQSEGERP